MNDSQTGLVGVGAMGRGILKRLRAAGQRVRAFDVGEASRETARVGGAEVVETAAEAARGAMFIHVIVPNDDDATEAIAGRSGVLAGASAGALILLHSTILPTTTQILADLAAKKGVDLIDAPVTAVPDKLEAGEGKFLVGGPAASVERARAQLLLIGQSVDHFGPVGAGNVAKIAKASINASERVLWTEVLQIVSAGGLDLRQFLEFERETSPERYVTRWKTVFQIEGNRARSRPSTHLFRKDVFLAAKLADIYGLDVPMTQDAAKTAETWVDFWEKTGARRD
jgi:3-hydroxyisobutyrate dehydrogenase-like beta-hydroxyacid dehydrogenase